MRTRRLPYVPARCHSVRYTSPAPSLPFFAPNTSELTLSDITFTHASDFFKLVRELYGPETKILLVVDGTNGPLCESWSLWGVKAENALRWNSRRHGTTGCASTIVRTSIYMTVCA